MFQNYQLLKSRTHIPVSQVQFIPKFLHPHEIIAVKELVQNYPFEEGTVLGGNKSGNHVLRQSEIKWIQWDDDNWWLYNKIMEKAQELNNMFWNFDLYGINEYIQYTEYRSMQSNRGHYDWHIDVSHEGIGSNRKLTFECILDDDHSGGEFSMLLGPTENRVKLSSGDAVLYPSFLLNKIYPVTTGTRSSLVSWLAGPSFK